MRGIGNDLHPWPPLSLCGMWCTGIISCLAAQTLSPGVTIVLASDMIMSWERKQLTQLTHQYIRGCEECLSRDYPDDPVPSPDCGWRMSCHTRWSLWSGLQAAASRHWPPGRQGTPASSCHHVWHLSYVCYLLDHDTPERGVRPAHYGDPETRRGAGDLHVAHLALQDRQPGDACNNNDNAMSKSSI